MRRIAVVALAVAALLLIGVVALALVSFDSPELGRAVLDQAGAAAGVELAAESYRLNLLDGLIADGVTASGAVPGGRFRLELEQLVFEHRLLPLLGGTIAVDRIRVERPRLELVTTGEAAAAAAGSRARDEAATPAEGAAGGPALEIGEIAFVDGAVALRDETGQVAPVDLEGIGFRMTDLGLDPSAASTVAGLNAAGRMEVARVALEATEVTDAAGDFTLKDGVLAAEGIAFRTPEGRFEVDLRVDLASVPLAYEMALRGDPLDLNQASGTPGGGFGPATFDMDAAGSGPAAEGVKGSGSVALAAGSLPAHPVLAGLEQAVGGSGIVGAEYDATEAAFRVERGQVLLEPLALRSGTTTMDLSGAIGLDPEQTLDLQMGLEMPRQGIRIEGVGDTVLDALTDEEGRVRIPVRITGPSQSPRVVPDAGAMAARAGRSGARALGEKAAEKLKGIFGN